MPSASAGGSVAGAFAMATPATGARTATPPA